jgi:DNA-binding transcriptional LysR family regulator
MNFKQLHSFVEVVHQGGFTEAAKVLKLSQSTVSKHVALLEQNLGDKVLQRMGGQVRLTDVGQIVLRRGEQLLSMRNDLATQLTALSGAPFVGPSESEPAAATIRPSLRRGGI